VCACKGGGAACGPCLRCQTELAQNSGMERKEKATLAGAAPVSPQNRAGHGGEARVLGLREAVQPATHARHAARPSRSHQTRIRAGHGGEARVLGPGREWEGKGRGRRPPWGLACRAGSSGSEQGWGGGG